MAEDYVYVKKVCKEAEGQLLSVVEGDEQDEDLTLILTLTLTLTLTLNPKS